MCLKSNTLLLTDVFENCKKTCLKRYELNSAKFLLAPGLAWQAVLKKTKVKLELLTAIDMLSIIEKGIKGGLYTLLIDMQKLIINIWKILIKIKNLPILNIAM